jgi:two-component system OmpR family sensor kinase
MFDPFSRGRTNGRTRTGSGLGLFIARRVLEAHGGSISLRSSKSGATFVIELPDRGVATIRILTDVLVVRGGARRDL